MRFRTPVEDPKDAIVLFVLLGIGMSCGLAAFGFAVLASAFLCLVLLILAKMTSAGSREMTLEIVAAGNDFPKEYVHSVFAGHSIDYEQREVARGVNTAIRYNVVLEAGLSLDQVNADLMECDSHSIESVTWVKPKKNTP